MSINGGFELTFRTDLFFNSAKVKKAVDDGTRRAMSKGLAYIRRRARSSIRRTRRSSLPGQPPRTHTSNPVVTIKNIQFQYDPASKSGICGPIKLHRQSRVRPVKTVPATLEFGGKVMFQRGAWAPQQQGTRTGQRTRLVRVQQAFAATYRARPFMGPALEKETQAGTILKAWEGEVHE